MLSKRLPLFLTLVPAFSIPLLPSCKSSETYETGAATGETIRSAADGIDKGLVTLDATMKSLEDLVEKPAADLGPQFKTFSTHLDTLDKQATEVRNLATKMEEKGKAYFAQWDQQIAAIANEDIKERSQDRRKEVDEALADLKENYNKAREQFRPLLADLKDVRSALAADLTTEGVKTVKKTAGKLPDKAEDAKETLTELSEQFRKLGVSIGKAPPPPPPK